MADSDFEFDEYLGGVKKGLNQAKGSTEDTESTGNKGTTGRSQYPFSVRLEKEYVEVIKALAWWKRISQREFIENCIGYVLDEMDEDKIKKILNRYRES